MSLKQSLQSVLISLCHISDALKQWMINHIIIAGIIRLRNASYKVNFIYKYYFQAVGWLIFSWQRSREMIHILHLLIETLLNLFRCWEILIIQHLKIVYYLAENNTNSVDNNRKCSSLFLLFLCAQTWVLYGSSLEKYRRLRENYGYICCLLTFAFVWLTYLIPIWLLFNQIAFDEGQARWHLLLIARIVRLKEIQQRVFLNVNAIVKE